MRAFHEAWAWVAVISTGVAGVWGLALAALKRRPDRGFTAAVWVAGAAMLLQAGVGLLTFAGGLRPGSDPTSSTGS